MKKKILIFVLCFISLSWEAEAVITLTGSYDLLGARKVFVSGNYAYVTAGRNGLHIVDVSNPAAPSFVGIWDTSWDSDDIYVSGNYAYVGADSPGLFIIDVSNPAVPSLIATYGVGAPSYDLCVYVLGNYVYVGDVFYGLNIIDISTPSVPRLLGRHDTAGSAEGVYVSGNYAYIADAQNGLQIMDTAFWVRKEAWDTPHLENYREVAYLGSADLDGDGDYDLMFGNEYQWQPIYAYENIGDVYSPTWRRKQSWEINPGFGNTRPVFCDLDGNGTYDLLCGENNGACRGYKNTGSISIPAWTREPLWDVESTGEMSASPAFADLDNDDDYDLLVGKSYYTYAYKNTGDRYNPIWTRNSEWDVSRDLYGIVSVSPEFCDLDNDGDFDILIGIKAIENTGTVLNPEWSRKTEWDAATIYPGVSAPAHPRIRDLDNDGDVDLLMGEYGGRDGGIAYAYERGPALAGAYTFLATGESINDVYVSGNYAYLASGDYGLKVVDVSDPASPTRVSSYDTAGISEGVYVSGDYAYIADTGSGLQIFDVSNPASPRLVDSYDIPGTADSVFVLGDYAYVADGSSLQILDISQAGVVLPAVSSFAFSLASLDQVAGVPFELTITAIDEEGNTVGGYAGQAELTVEYLSPDSGTMSLSLPSPATISGFVDGQVTIPCRYDDSGSLTITATDTSNPDISGTSGAIMFFPASFEVTASSPQKVNQEFSLTIKARNALGDITPNCNLAVSSGVTAHVPAVGGEITPAVIGSSFVNGVEEVSAAYNSWAGSVDVNVSVPGNPDFSGTRAAMVFLPDMFEVIVDSPPPDRTKFYINEPIPITIRAVDTDGDTITNYGGTIGFWPISHIEVPPNYTFRPEEGGIHPVIYRSSEAQNFPVTVEDADYIDIKGASALVQVIYAKIEVDSGHIEVGEEGEVNVYIKGEDGNIVSLDNSTTFSLSLAPAGNSAQIISLNSPVSGGIGSFIIRDSIEEVVTVTPSSAPALTAVNGVISFKPFVAGPGGIRILHWIEEK